MRTCVTLLIALAALMTLAGARPAAAQGTVSGIRLVNAVPDGPPLDLVAGDQGSLIPAIERFKASPYVAVASGNYTLTVAPPDGASIEVAATLRPGHHYTLAIVGPRARAEARLFEDDPGQPDGGKLRLYHLSIDAPSVDLRRADGQTLAGGVAFGEASAYVTGAADGELQVLPAQVPAPILARLATGAAPVQSIFVVGALASIKAFAVADVAVVDMVRPAMLPNTAGATGSMIVVTLIGAGLCVAGVLLRRRAASA